MQPNLRHDLRLRAAASVIYHAVYPSARRATISFGQVMGLETIFGRRAVEVALCVHPVLTALAEQPRLV